MSFGAYLGEMLAPLGLAAAGSLAAAELAAVGEQLDAVAAELDELACEMLPLRAESWGLEQVEALLGRRPNAPSLQRRRESLAALLRIGAKSATVQDINDTLSGCGLIARARDGAVAGQVEVYFPEVAGVPKGIEGIQKIIGEILPCHLEILYCYWRITWAELATHFARWDDMESRGFCWTDVEQFVGEGAVL
jgi:Uncharacterized protein conserved in bacteria (DUF2313).